MQDGRRRSTRGSRHTDPGASKYDEQGGSSRAVAHSRSQSPVAELGGAHGLEHEEEDDAYVERAPQSGPSRRAASNIAPKASRHDKIGKEKRKRSRVSPEQLVHLETYFAADRSPTAPRRKEISSMLGMNERQTQIWFQNRRAKAKLQESRSQQTDNDPNLNLPPTTSTGEPIDLTDLLHEENPITIIPCSDLSIGSWRRIATTVNSHELIAYICDAKRCLVWFIHSAGQSFKMELSYDSVVSATFTGAGGGVGLASFTVSEPPAFYLEQTSSPRSDGSVLRTWRRSVDWTEGQQATVALRHDLIGSAAQLTHLVQNLRALVIPDNSAHLQYTPSTSQPAQAPISAPVHQNRENIQTDLYQRPSTETYQSERPDDYHRSPIEATSRPHPQPYDSTYSVHHTPDQGFSSDAYSPGSYTRVSQDIHHSPTALDTHARGSAPSYHYPSTPVALTYPATHSSMYSYADSGPRQMGEPGDYHHGGLRRTTITPNMSQSMEAARSPPLLTTPFHPPNSGAPQGSG